MPCEFVPFWDAMRRFQPEPDRGREAALSESVPGSLADTPPVSSERQRRRKASPLAEEDSLGSSFAQTTLRELPTALLVVDSDRQIVGANEAAAGLLGSTVAELVECECDSLLQAPEGSLVELSELQNQQAVARCRDAALRSVEYSCRAVEHEQNERFFVVTFQDSTRLRALEKERNRLLRIATIGEALPSLLHELKNPLAAIHAATEVLIEETTAPDVQEQLHAILSEIRRMKLSFDGIGALERPFRTGVPDAIDFACREAGAVMALRAKNAGIHLKLRISDMPLLPFDAGVMRALVLNFVTNAIQASEQDSVITMNVWWCRETNALELRVVDTGRGMSPEVLRRTTELFFSTKPSGSGIGLALCRRVVEGAGGRLQLNSVPGFGTAVEVTVPCEPGAETRGRGGPSK